MRAIMSKFLALGGLSDGSDANTLLRKQIDLADFLRPDVFLNALRQQSARSLKWVGWMK